MAWLLANLGTHRDKLIENHQDETLHITIELQSILLDNMGEDNEIAADCLWGICSILDNANEEIIQLMVGNGVQGHL